LHEPGGRAHALLLDIPQVDILLALLTLLVRASRVARNKSTEGEHGLTSSA
jgi:hypothetical protein